jgi:hypothetical protein
MLTVEQRIPITVRKVSPAMVLVLMRSAAGQATAAGQ